MKRLSSLSIRTHLLMLSAIMLLVPLCILVHSSLKQRAYQVNETRLANLHVANQVSSEVSGFTASTELLLATLSRLSMVQPRDSTAVNSLLADIVKQYPDAGIVRR